VVAWAAARWGAQVVVPVDFADVASFSKHREVFEGKGIALAAPAYRAVVAASDKRLLPELLRGVAETPRQVVVQSKKDIASLDALEPPLVIKDFGDASKPEFFPLSTSAAERALARAPCLVQEYVPGVARGYYAVAFEGRPLLEFTHERLVEYDPAGGASLAARGPVNDPRLYRFGRLIIAKLHWTGPIMVETKFIADEGRYLVVELNPKLWGSLDLPVSLGYHFPLILALAATEGEAVAREAAKGLSVRSGVFSWVLDGMRYLAKVPSTWVRLVRKGLEGGCDVDPLDPGRVLMQMAWALRRLSREAGRWREGLKESYVKLGWWIRKLSSKGFSNLVFDLDGTLVAIPVNWRAAKRELIERGLAKPWEGITESLRRPWEIDENLYRMASELIEKHELQATARAWPLIDPHSLAGLDIIMVTLQTSRVAAEALRQAGFRCRVTTMGRDAYGPCKEHAFARIPRISIVFEDNLANAVRALRAGHLPVLVSSDSYAIARGLRLGIPALRHVDVPRLLEVLNRLS